MEHSKPEELINILAVLAFAPTANGEGLMLVTDTQHGPLNLALSVDTVRQVLRGMVQALVACSLRRPEQPPLPETTQANSVYLPADELLVLPELGAHKRLLVRVGTVDFAIMIPTKETAQALARDLLAH